MGNELVLLRNSERATWRRCRQKHLWSYEQRHEPQREKGALVFGRLVHEALEIYYPPGRKRGPHPARTFETLYERQLQTYGEFGQWDEEGNRHDALDLGITMLKGYVDKYGKDDHVNIIAPEQVLTIDVYDRQGNYLCTWVGKVDAVYEDISRSTPRRKVLGMKEHKTAKSIEEDLRINSGYGEQGLSYFWALDLWARHHDLLPKGQHVDHIMFNWLKKALPDSRPANAEGHRLNNPKKEALVAECQRLGLSYAGRLVDELHVILRDAGVDPWQLGEVSKKQPKPLFHRYKLDVNASQVQEINRRIRAEAWEIAQARAGKLPIYKNPTKDCSWDCQFVEACELHEMGADFESMFDLEFDTWNPYEEHELELEKV